MSGAEEVSKVRVLLRTKEFLRPEDLESVRKKIADDLKNDGVAIIPAGYEIVGCETQSSDSLLFEE